MGANRQQGWALLLFLIGFTFFVAGLFDLGPLFTIAGFVCLIVSLAWSYRNKPLEYQSEEPGSVEAPMPPKKKQAV